MVGLFNRPKHAAIGAKVFQDHFLNLFSFNNAEDVRLAGSMAIAKHHSAAREGQTHFQSFKVTEPFYPEIKKLLDEYMFDFNPSSQETESTLDDFEFEEQEMIYLLLVRWLRLCDQKATGNLQKYYNG